MDAMKLQKVWIDFLEGRLARTEAAEVEDFLERCSEEEIPPVIEADFAQFLRERIPVETAPSALRARVLASMPAVGSMSLQGTSAATSGAKSGTIGSNGVPWYQRLMSNSRTPRLAMAAILVLMVAIPMRVFFHSPALAYAMVDRHKCHAPLYGTSMPSCCERVSLSEGDIIPKNAHGAVVPNLKERGLELIATSRCRYKGTLVNLFGYRSSDGEVYSLFISDRFAAEFRQIKHKHQKRGIMQASYVAEEQGVTLWERNGVVYFWVGPEDANHDDAVLSALQTN